jgi:hypothetical protein
MRVAVALIALLFSTGAGVPETAQVQPETRIAPLTAEAPRAVCRDTVQQVRRELGQPVLERDASPRDPLLIAAVDKRIGGCSVLVMRDDTSDIRPLPAPQEHRMMPAK